MEELATTYKDGCLLNVLKGISNESFSTYAYPPDEAGITTYSLIYTRIPKKGEISGHILSLNPESEDRNVLVYGFACGMVRLFKLPPKNIRSIFNTFQHQFRTALEQDDYFTYTAEDEDNLKPGMAVLLPKGCKKMLYIHFDVDEKKKTKEPQKNYVYIMRNRRSGYHKIGKSNDPVYRERTLQSEDPDVYLVFKGEGDVAKEKSLHQKFKHKRIRGEWFDLTPEELKEIKTLLKCP
jgi:hypothetical protein